jgi:hypothetical protein
MNIAELEAAGAFVQDALVEKEVVWKNGKAEHKFKVYIRPQSFGAIETVQEIQKDKSKMASYVSRQILDAEGNPTIPYDKAVNLKPTLGTALLQAINEVNSGADVKN